FDLQFEEVCSCRARLQPTPRHRRCRGWSCELSSQHSDAEQREAAMARWRRRCKPMPSQHARLTWERTFTADELRRIGRGVIPRRMEHKWFNFVEGDTIQFHRSWTGFCIYQMQVRTVSEGFPVQCVVVNRDPEQNRCTDDEYDLALLDFLTSNLLLGRRKA